MYKKTQGILPTYHCKQIPTKYDDSDNIDIETRQKYNVILQTHSTCSDINSLNSKIGTVWNKLPFEIKSTNFKTINTFAKYVKANYMSKYVTECSIRNCYICSL